MGSVAVLGSKTVLWVRGLRDVIVPRALVGYIRRSFAYGKGSFMRPLVFAPLLLVAACSSSSTSSSTSDAATCGTMPAGTTCATSTGACSPLQCIGSTWGCAAGTRMVAVVPGACFSSADASGGCGPMPAGSTCQTPGGACNALQCLGSYWGCPAGDVQVAVVPGNCSGADAAQPTDATDAAQPTDATDAASDGGCGATPVGSTCKTSAGTCTPLQCIGSSWGCAAGETEVAVVPGACSAGDAATDALSNG